ncbi:MAG: hypothetical protein LBT67_03020 [Holosporaceae bacterium]|jgi:hypothetical protein|nr:hypothetical protein [Holosporaceae bacterium]
MKKLLCVAIAVTCLNVNGMVVWDDDQEDHSIGCSSESLSFAKLVVESGKDLVKLFIGETELVAESGKDLVELFIGGTDSGKRSILLNPARQFFVTAYLNGNVFEFTGFHNLTSLLKKEHDLLTKYMQ